MTGVDGFLFVDNNGMLAAELDWFSIYGLTAGRFLNTFFGSNYNRSESPNSDLP